MTIPPRLERTVTEVEQALEWWAQLTSDGKKRWLQCEETSDEIEKMLQSPVLSERDLAKFGAVGDAWNAFREETLIVLDFNDVIRAGCGEPPPHLTPRERYEHDAEIWDAEGRSADLLETYSLRLIVLRCWYYSDGCLKEYDSRPLSDTFLDYLNACLEARWNENPNWYEEELHERTNCDRCGERYMLENLRMCTDCLSAYCHACAPDFPKAANGNPSCGCKLLGSSGGELVG